MPATRFSAIADRWHRIRSKIAEAATYRCGTEPEVHGEYLALDRPGESSLIVYRRVRGRTVSLLFTLPTESMEAWRASCFELAASLECDLDPWPERPEGYEFEDAAGFEIAFAAGLDRKVRKDVVRLVESTVKDFRRVHGDPLILPGEPPVLLITRDPEANAEFVLERVSANTARSNNRLRRLSSIPVLDATPQVRGELVRVVYEYLASTLYPVDYGQWVRIGESRLAGLAEEIGRGLPYVPPGWERELPLIEVDFDELAGGESNALVGDYMAWVAFLRHGPSKYRKAYDAFLAEMRETFDPEATFERHFGEFDAATLRQEAATFLREKLKTAQPR